jgi:hypothetical protein
MKEANSYQLSANSYELAANSYELQLAASTSAADCRQAPGRQLLAVGMGRWLLLAVIGWWLLAVSC